MIRKELLLLEQRENKGRKRLRSVIARQTQRSRRTKQSLEGKQENDDEKKNIHVLSRGETKAEERHMREAKKDESQLCSSDSDRGSMRWREVDSSI